MMSDVKTVFIVDDDADVRRSLGTMLANTGYSIELFHSGVKFLNEYVGASPGCILMDIVMPDMSGLEVLDQISEKSIANPIIMMTGQADVPMAIRALESGAFAFIEKPFRRDDLLARIASAVEHDARNRKRLRRHTDMQRKLEPLTPREREVLNLVVEGKLTKQIAKDLGISQRTVETHRGNIMSKVEVDSLAELVSMVTESRFTGPDSSEEGGASFRSKRPWRSDDAEKSPPSPANLKGKSERGSSEGVSQDREAPEGPFET